MKWATVKVLVGFILSFGLMIGWAGHERTPGATVSFGINVQQQQPQSQFFVRSDVGGTRYQQRFDRILNECTGLELRREKTGPLARDQVVLSPQSPQQPPQGISTTLFNLVRTIVTSGQGPLEIFVHERIQGVVTRTIAGQNVRGPLVTWVDAFRVVPVRKVVAGYNFKDFRAGDPGRGTVDLADWQKFPIPQDIQQLGLPAWVTDRWQILIHVLSEYWHSATVNPNYDVSHGLQPVLPDKPGFLFDDQKIMPIVDTNFFKVGKCLRVKTDFKGIEGVLIHWQATQVQECQK